MTSRRSMKRKKSIASVKDLLKTGFLEGEPICYVFEGTVLLKGFIHGTGYICDCSTPKRCKFSGQEMSAKVFEAHAGCTTHNPNDHIFLKSEKSLYEIMHHLREVRGGSLHDEIKKAVEVSINEEVVKLDEKDIPYEAQALLALSDNCANFLSDNIDEKGDQKTRGTADGAAGEGIIFYAMEKGSIINETLDGDKFPSNHSTVVTGSEDVNDEGPDRNGLSPAVSDGFRETRNITTDVPNGEKLSSVLSQKVRHSEAGRAEEPAGDRVTSVVSERGREAGCITDVVSDVNIVPCALSEVVRGTELLQEKARDVDILPPLSVDSKGVSQNIISREATTDSAWPFMPGTKEEFKSPFKFTVKDLLSTGVLDGVKVTYKNKGVEKTGIVKDLGYLCGCSECDYKCKVLSASEFERHAGVASSNQNGHIYLENGVSLYDLMHELRGTDMQSIFEVIKEKTDCCPSITSLTKWIASRQLDNSVDDVGAVSKELQDLGTGSSLKKSFQDFLEGAAAASHSGPNDSCEEPAKFCGRSIETSSTTGSSIQRTESSPLNDNMPESPNLKFEESVDTILESSVRSGSKRVSQRRSKGARHVNGTSMLLRTPESSKKSSYRGVRYARLTSSEPTRKRKKRTNFHQVIFSRNLIQDGESLTYRLGGQVKIKGQVEGTNIICDCHGEKLSPSQFEAHAGFEKRRQPYRNIFTCDGLSLHTMAMNAIKSDSSGVMDGNENLDADSNKICSTSGSEEFCAVCGNAGEFAKCDGCFRACHSACLQLNHPSRSRWLCSSCAVDEDKSKKNSSSKPLKRTLLANDSVWCTICKDGNTTLGELSPNLIIFCNQCDKAFHACCLQDFNQDNLEAVIAENWYCSPDCQLVSASLRKTLQEGNLLVPSPLSRVNLSEGDLYWQLVSGKAEGNKELLQDVTEVLNSAFTPVGEHEFLNSMVSEQQVDALGLDFRGMYSAVVTVKSVVIAVGLLRVFDRNVAELPLVAIHEGWRGKGFFRTLLSLVELLLSHNRVKWLVTPVDDATQHIWINKLGFSKADNEFLRKLEEYPITKFENTSFLQKAIREG